MFRLVLLVTDLEKCPALLHTIGQMHPAEIFEHRDVGEADLKSADMVIVDIADGTDEEMSAVREALAKSGSTVSVGLTRGDSRRDKIQADALGLTRVWSRTRLAKEALREIDQLFGSYALADLPKSTPEQTARSVQAMSAALGECATAVVTETLLPLTQVARAVDDTLDAFRLDGMDAWISAVQMHHSHTYCHSMLVTGYALAFSSALGLSSEEQAFLGAAALLHDVGKVYIPLSILDKPAKLTDEEFAIIRQHPVRSREILEAQPHVSQAVIDIAVHHHEYLDGSGYPDGLKGDEISRAVRMLTICDIYAALIEKRAYKPAYSPRQAYGVLVDLGKKIDQPLLKAFRSVAFEVDKAASVKRKASAFG
ncbi:HD-GYP domain-containing protein [Pannonibacter carbonis]|uniref:HD-GYP domain-containing protein n=1 Tax=Pannonibacter carbonis TaxID=2067569 RepID=UPI0013002BD6|nr:HD domain-containing phosphohydrolase [Pannonibacter carbonis]